MRQFFKMFFASFLAMVVMGVLFFFVIIGLIVGISKSVVTERKKTIADNSILYIETGKFIHELGESNSLATILGEDEYSPGLYDVLKAIEHAKTDKDIKGIFIKLENDPNGWATLQQVRDALADFKSSGKFIYAYGEMIPQKSYYLGSVADSIFLNPAGFTELNGLATQMPFFKGLFEKLEVQPQVFYAGKYKSATEPFRADKMSEPNRQQVAAVQADIWGEFLKAVSEHTQTDTYSLHQLALAGTVQFPENALKHKLIDGMLYWDQVEQRMREKTGRKESEKISYVSLNDYASQLRHDRKIKNDRIAVLFAEGAIKDGEGRDAYEIASRNFIDEIRKVAKNDKIKAVVLRINSPGGSALASEVILRELQILRQKKPLIVSMGDYAASGGYYISCQADSIFALPNTITGSIGVFAICYNAQNLLKNKLGITFDGEKNAPYADFPSTVRPLSISESQKMQSIVDTIYSTFKNRVVTGRNMPADKVDEIAQGRVWTGQDALEIGLVDGLGGLDRAIRSAAAKANLKDYHIVTYPAPVDRFEMLMKRVKGADASAEVAKALMQAEMTEEFQFYKKVKSFQQINGKAQTALPFDIRID